MVISSPRKSDIPRLKELFAETFGDSGEFVSLFFDTAFSCDRARAVYCDSKIVAMLYWFDCEYEGKSLAYVYAVATDKNYRGQGLCRMLMDNTHAYLKAQGYLGAILVPSEPSLFDFYSRLGYKTATYIDEFECEGATEGCVIEKINKAEYAQLRREYLPIGSVIQEKENLEFLDSLAHFIKGEDFILSYSIYDYKLHAYELLGNRDKAPKILYSLSVKDGTFRAFGNGRPFTMLYPFAPDLTTPTHFAFAFD